MNMGRDGLNSNNDFYEDSLQIWKTAKISWKVYKEEDFRPLFVLPSLLKMIRTASALTGCFVHQRLY